MRTGLFVGGCLMALIGLAMVSGGAMHWFFFALLALGLTTIGMAFIPEAQHDDSLEGEAVTVPAQPDLRGKLEELDALLADGHLTKAEHKAQRKAVLDAWVKP